MSSIWMSGLLLVAQGLPTAPPSPPLPPTAIQSQAVPPQISVTRVPPFPNDAVALRSLPTLFSTADYPSAALRGRQQGLVGFNLTIGTTGTVDGCTVSQSSGSAALDGATCSILQRRARFFPARDATGRAIKGAATGRVRWALPVAPALPFANRSEHLAYLVDARGALGPCRLELSTDPWQSSIRLCDMRKPFAERALRTYAAKGEANGRELVLGDGALLDGTLATLDHGRGPGEKTLFRLGMALKVDPSGKITSCAPSPGDTNSSVTQKACHEFAQRRFAAPVSKDVGAERSITLYRIGYTRPIR